MVSARVTLATVSAGMPAERACTLTRSDVPCYDNLTRVADSATWAYNGGPNNNATFTGATGYLALLAAYCPSRSDKMRFEWSYSMSASAAVAAALKPKTVGGTINGLVNNATALLPFGSTTLYGSRYLHTGGLNSLADVTNPAEQARLLGDDPASASYADNMRGISDWARSSSLIKVMLHDDGACAWASHSGGGSFRDTTFAGFTGHGQAQDYRSYLRGVYANDAGYDAARAANTVPAYTAARQWLLDKTVAWHAQARVRAQAHGMEYVINIAGALPNKHPQSSFAAGIYACDYGMCELAWQNYAREGTPARYVTDRATAENLADPTTLRRMFASQALTAATLRGAGRRATFAPYPLIDWVPPKSGGPGSAPVTTPYTVPLKVERQQRISWAWLQALGFPSVIPAYIYDEAVDLTEFGFTGYTGNNKPSFYMPPSVAKGWFEWVAARRDVLNAFDLAATVAIVQPLIGDYWRGAVDGVTPYYYTWVESYLRPLIEANVPFVILPVDDAMGYPLTGYDLSGYRAVINAASNALTLPGNLTDLSPVTVAGHTDATRPVMCVPRIDRTGNRLALHVVNTNSCDYAANSGAGAVGATQSAVTVALKPWAMLSRRITSARWYSHEAALQGSQLSVSMSVTGPLIKIPAFVEAGIVVLEFA